MKYIVQVIVALGVFLIVGCGGGSGSTQGTEDNRESTLKYTGSTDRLDLLTKANIPNYLEALDISIVRDFVKIYTDLPYDEIIKKGKDISKKEKGKNGGNQSLSIHIVDATILKLVHVFTNYNDGTIKVNGMIKDTVTFDNGEYFHRISIIGLKVSRGHQKIVVEGLLKYSSSKGLMIKSFLIKNSISSEMFLYENFIANDSNGDPVLYSGRICHSSAGCVKISTSYDKDKAHSDIIIIEGENNTATVKKDYTSNFLVDVSLVDDLDMHSYLVFDGNHSAAYNLLYEANISKKENTFFEGQRSLVERVHPIKIEDINDDGKNDLIFLTDIQEDSTLYDKRLYVQYAFDIKTLPKNILSYDLTDKGHDDRFFLLDASGNGLKDIYIPKYFNWGLLIQEKNHTFVEKSLDPKVLSWDKDFSVDFNGDGKDDRVQLHGCSLEVFTDFNNDSIKTLIPLSGCSNYRGDPVYNEGLSLKLSDLNNDGYKDFIVVYRDERDPVVNGNISFLIALNSGNGTIAELSAKKLEDGGERLAESSHYAVGEDVIVGDIDNDGYNDIIIKGYLLLNQKNSTFVKKAKLKTRDSFGGEEYLGIFDVNNDGRKDIVFSGYLGIRAVLIGRNYDSTDILLSADGDKREAANIAIGKYTNDSKLDIVRNYNNRIEIILIK